MNTQKRAQKRFRRENRANKGAKTEARREEYNRMVRQRRDYARNFGIDPVGIDAFGLLSLGLLSKRA